MYKIICWGAGRCFEDVKHFLDKTKNVEIIALVDEKAYSNGEFLCVRPENILNFNFDYLVVSSSRYFGEICFKIDKMGISFDRVLDYKIFFEQGFDFDEYVKKGWITNRVINSVFSETSYLDLKRHYKGKNIDVFLGRKSYVGEMIFDTCGFDYKCTLNIGNYSSISSNVILEIGLNLDHDYHNITNYGLSHLNYCGYDLDKLKSQNIIINIGSDVWIGKNCFIKGGVNIGDGAVVASNSYIVNDVPEYSIVGGNPAKTIKYRFDEYTIEAVKSTRWWELDEKDLAKFSDCFNDPITFVEKYRKIYSGLMQ